MGPSVTEHLSLKRCFGIMFGNSEVAANDQFFQCSTIHILYFRVRVRVRVRVTQCANTKMGYTWRDEVNDECC